MCAQSSDLSRPSIECRSISIMSNANEPSECCILFRNKMCMSSAAHRIISPNGLESKLCNCIAYWSTISHNKLINQIQRFNSLATTAYEGVKLFDADKTFLPVGLCGFLNTRNQVSKHNWHCILWKYYFPTMKACIALGEGSAFRNFGK